MTPAAAGRAPATFEIKSAQLQALSLQLKSPDIDALAAELQARYGDTPEFFEHDALVIDLGPLRALPDPALADADVDFSALVALLRRHRVLPVAARGGSPAQMQAALAAGLAPAPDLVASILRRQPAQHAQPEPAPAAASPQPATPPASPPAAQPAPGALVIDKPLRSGQQVYARGRDLVVMSMVNPGAEVIADGHIHVYAPLRGKAIAGARGDTTARIISLCLEPELVSIAGVYRTSDVPLPADVLARPTQVRLEGDAGSGKLVMEPLRA